MTATPRSLANPEAPVEAPPPPGWMDSLYERLVEDNEGRVCKDIPEAACSQSPRAFAWTLMANTLSSIADKLASAKTTLPWLLLQLGAPAFLLGLLVPIRESGSMLPQVWLGGVVRRLTVRKWVWVIGGVVQGLCLALMALVALTLQGLPAGIAIVLLLVAFSLARAGCSLAFKDVQGKTIPKTRRGRLSGWVSAIAGLAALLVGAGLSRLQDGNGSDVGLYAGLLAFAAVLWWLAAAGYSRIVEYRGATKGGANGIAEAWQRLRLLRDDAPFRRFVIARALALGSGLAAPFYIATARDNLGEAVALLGVFIAMEGLAGLLSSPVWGRWADRSSRQVFAVAAGLAGVLSVVVAIVAFTGLPEGAAWVFYPAALFVLGIAHAGIRLGRKTYLVDMARGNKRTEYVAVSNSVIGFLLLGTGVLGALAASVSVPLTLLLLGLAGVWGAALSLRWREVSG